MKSKQIIAVIGVLALLLLVGVFFAYYSINSENLIGFEKKPLEKNTVGQNSNADKSSNLKSIINKKTISGPPIVNNAKENEKVVDQTLRAARDDNKGFGREKSILEITLYDGEQNSLLINYPIEIEYSFNNETPIKEHYISDKTGKIQIQTNEIGFVYLNIFTNDYPVTCNAISIYSGSNYHNCIFYKGGTIEVRAINLENKIVKGLQVIFPYNEYFQQSNKSDFPIHFDSKRGLYVVTKIPLGIQEMFFKAKGYLESTHFKINIEFTNITTLEIKLLPPRRLYIDLDLANKPKLIQILKTNVVFGCGSLGSYNPPIPCSMNIKPIDGFKSFINQNNMYEYSLEENEVPFLTIYVDNFAPHTINVFPYQDTYKIFLSEIFEAQVKIIDEIGNAVNGARIDCYSNDFSQTVNTGKDGFAKLTSSKNVKSQSISIFHPNFVRCSTTWDFDTKNSPVKTIILLEGKEVRGEVKFKDKSIEGAKVFLIKKIHNFERSTQLYTDQKGKYSFSHLDIEEADYFIQASYLGNGTATSPKFKLLDKTTEINLDLKEESILLVRVVDKNDLPISNQNVTLNCNSIGCEWQQKTTNEKGECQFKNLFEGSLFTINLADYIWKDENKSFVFPQKEFVIKAEKNDFRDLVLLKPDGNEYSGLLTSGFSWGAESYYLPINLKLNKKNRFSLEANKLIKSIDNKIIKIEVPGYAIVELDTYEKMEDIPKELKFQLNLGERLKIKIVDDVDNKPVTTAITEVSFGGLMDRVFPVNEKGEVDFLHLIGKNKILIKAESYALYQCEIDVSQVNEILVKLTKCGQLKGYIPIKNSHIIDTWLILTPVTLTKNQVAENRIRIEEKGNFIINNLLPGEYTVSIKSRFDESSMPMNLPSNKIIVESGKITEINFDGIISK